MDIYDIQMKALAQEALSGQEAAFVADKINSGLLTESLAAHLVQLAVGNDAEQAAAAQNLRAICEKGLPHEEAAELAMLLAMIQLPTNELKSTKAYRDFAFAMARSNSTPCRINSLVVLRRLAKKGDKELLDLLDHAASDPDKHVRVNVESIRSKIESE